MKNAIEAIYENGAFRPLHPDAVAIPPGQVVRLTIENEKEPEQLKLAAKVYDGLSEDDIADVERIAMNRNNFFGSRNVEQ